MTTPKITPIPAPQATVVSREVIYKRYTSVQQVTLDVRRLKDSSKTMKLEREVFMTGKVSAVVCYDPENDKILLIRLFRIGAFLGGITDSFMFEIPAGFIDDGETPEDAARREGMEETGMQFSSLIPVGGYYLTPGGSTEKVHIFIGRISAPETGIFGLESEQEELETVLFDANDVFKMLDNGSIQNGTASIALNWFARHRDRIRKEWLSS